MGERYFLNANGPHGAIAVIFIDENQKHFEVIVAPDMEHEAQQLMKVLETAFSGELVSIPCNDNHKIHEVMQ